MKLRTDVIQCLLNEARFLDTKPPEKHNMKVWECGTANCAIGDIAKRGELDLFLEGGFASHPIFFDVHNKKVKKGMFAVIAAMEIPRRYADFLFAPKSVSLRYKDVCTGLIKNELPQETAARIRKFLYYFMRKAEILADYEQARRTGDIGINSVKKEIREKCLELV